MRRKEVNSNAREIKDFAKQPAPLLEMRTMISLTPKQIDPSNAFERVSSRTY